MDELELIAALRALGEPTRWKVMRLLAESEQGMAAGDIASGTSGAAEYAVIAYAALTRCGLVDGHRQGRKIVYSANSRNARRFATQLSISLGEASESAAS